LRALVVGSGAREHALTWAFSKSTRLSALYIAPGNEGTAELGTNIPDLDPVSSRSVIEACKEHRIDAVLVGPEDPLAAGLVDELAAAAIPVLGPPRRAAQLEASKVFSKQFMQRHRIPTATAATVTKRQELEGALERLKGMAVLKQDGLAAGKGVLASADKSALYEFGRDALDKGPVLVEEFLEGYELSVFVLMDGDNFSVLPPCADFKKAGEADTGPNTGGMGSICPVPWVENAVLDEIETRVVMPTLAGMKEEGLAYKGILYCGLMVTKKGPRVLEYNVRLGDPETQALVPLIQSDFGNLIDALLNGTLIKFGITFRPLAATGVVVASAGYPGPYRKGVPVEGLPQPGENEGLVFHATTHADRSGRLLTGGGRCFTVVGLGNDALSATEKAYALAPQVRFDGAWYRPDIGRKLFAE
jgi:phosphoribosylamine--glycine ligase